MISKSKKRLNTTLSIDVWDYLENRSSQLGITKSEYIEMLLRKEVTVCDKEFSKEN